MIPPDIRSERLLLTALTESHAGERYQRWMHSPEVTQYLESRHSLPSLAELRSYVDAVRKSSDSYIFAIQWRDSGEHIGNIKLGPVDPFHLRAAIGIVIGEKTAWGQGVAGEAVAALTGWAFSELGLQKIKAGSYAANVGSIKAFQRAGFAIEGRHVNEVLMANGERGDVVSLGASRNDWP